MATWQFWLALFVAASFLLQAFRVISGRTNAFFERHGRRYSARAARIHCVGDVLIAISAIGQATEWAIGHRLTPVAALRTPVFVVGVFLVLGPWGRTQRVTPETSSNSKEAGDVTGPSEVTPTS